MGNSILFKFSAVIQGVIITTVLPCTAQSLPQGNKDKSGPQTILSGPANSVGDFDERSNIKDLRIINKSNIEIPKENLLPQVRPELFKTLYGSNIPHDKILPRKLPNDLRPTPPSRRLQLPPSNVGDFDHTLRKRNIFEDAKQNPYKYRDDIRGKLLRR